MLKTRVGSFGSGFGFLLGEERLWRGLWERLQIHKRQACLGHAREKGKERQDPEIKRSAFVLRMCGRPCPGEEMDPERGKVCASDTRQQMGGKVVGLCDYFICTYFYFASTMGNGERQSLGKIRRIRSKRF